MTSWDVMDIFYPLTLSSKRMRRRVRRTKSRSLRVLGVLPPRTRLLPLLQPHPLTLFPRPMQQMTPLLLLPPAAATTAAAAAPDPDAAANEAVGQKRKRRPSNELPPRKSTAPMLSRQASVASVAGGAFVTDKKYRAVPTSSIPGYEKVWPNPHLPPIGVRMDDEVGRDLAVRAEQEFVKVSTSVDNKDEADRLREEWLENRLKKTGGPTVLPMRLEDIRTMSGSELAGYMPRRGDFDIEWDNDAEAILAEMEFSADDAPQDRQLKLQIVEIYNAKLDERERRKQFLIDRKLLDYRKNQAEDLLLPPDERDLVNRMRLFARFHSPEEHEKFIKDLLKAKRLRKEIARLQQYRRMGIQTLAEAEKYELDRDRREHHKVALRQKEADDAKAAKVAAASSTAASSTDDADGPSVWKKYGSDRRSRGDGSGSAVVSATRPMVRRSRLAMTPKQQRGWRLMATVTRRWQLFLPLLVTLGLTTSLATNCYQARRLSCVKSSSCFLKFISKPRSH